MYTVMDGTATSYAMKHSIEDLLYNKTVSKDVLEDIEQEVENALVKAYKKMDGSKFLKDEIEVFVIDEQIISSADIIYGNTRMNPKYSNSNCGSDEFQISKFNNILARCNTSMQNSNDIGIVDSSFLGDYRIVTFINYE